MTRCPPLSASRTSRKRQTTQFIVGAAGEKDEEIVKYMHGMYERLNMHRIYFSAYQREADTMSFPRKRLPAEVVVAGESSECNEIPAFAGMAASSPDPFMREHRLYQVDFLLRKYGFDMNDIVFDETGNLSLSRDPKELLLKVPGLGHITVADIIAKRRQSKISGVHQLGRVGLRLSKANRYLAF